MKLTVMFLPLCLFINYMMNAKFWPAVFCDVSHDSDFKMSVTETDTMIFRSLGWVCSSVVEYLLSMCKALDSIPAPQTKNRIVRNLMYILDGKCVFVKCPVYVIILTVSHYWHWGPHIYNIVAAIFIQVNSYCTKQ